MSKPKDGETRTKDGKKQKYNAYTGRWVTQTNPIKNVSRLLTSLNLKPRIASEGKEGKAKITKAKQKKAGFSRTETITKAKDTSKRSPGPSQYTQQESKASKTGPLGGKNPYYKEKKKYGEEFKNAPKLEIGTKYKDDKPSADTSPSKSKSKKEEIMIGGKKATSIQKRLIKGGWTVKELEAKQKKHREWKKNRGR